MNDKIAKGTIIVTKLGKKTSTIIGTVLTNDASADYTDDVGIPYPPVTEEVNVFTPLEHNSGAEAKIVIVGSAYPLRGGGISTFNERLAKAYIDNGDDGNWRRD